MDNSGLNGEQLLINSVLSKLRTLRALGDGEMKCSADGRCIAFPKKGAAVAPGTLGEGDF